MIYHFNQIVRRCVGLGALFLAVSTRLTEPLRSRIVDHCTVSVCNKTRLPLTVGRAKPLLLVTEENSRPDQMHLVAWGTSCLLLSESPSVAQDLLGSERVQSSGFTIDAECRAQVFLHAADHLTGLSSVDSG